jgi:dolichol-phosphate mannosyltransferase
MSIDFENHVFSEHHTRRDESNCSYRLAVVVPCFKVSRHLPDLLSRIGPEVSAIYCVDDACPEESGQVARAIAERDPRIRVVVHRQNTGVGGAVLSGYGAAIADGAEIIVKLDGDGQMSPEDIPRLIAPIVRGEADYVKGNRFFHLEHLRAMPWIRLLGNAGLSFLSKLSSGYWNLFDPTNGFTAIHGRVAEMLPADKISRRYFFESDLLFRLNSLRAVVADVPIEAHYADEESSLSQLHALVTFPANHLRNFFKRMFYNYFLRDFNFASINLVLGFLLVAFGLTFGSIEWLRGVERQSFASAGTVMLAALPMVLGWQALLSFIHFDITNIPTRPLHRLATCPPSLNRGGHGRESETRSK